MLRGLIAKSARPLLLHSSNTVYKGTPPIPARLLWTTPNPRFRPKVELFCGDPRSQLDLLRVGEALSGQGLASEQSPPRFLEVEPARPHWNEDLLHSQMLLQPLPDRWALMAGEVVGYEVQIAARIPPLDGFE